MNCIQLLLEIHCSGEFKLEEHVEKFEGYDGWGSMEYNLCNKARQAGIANKPESPVAYFYLEDEW